jgi:hypothetical protein
MNDRAPRPRTATLLRAAILSAAALCVVAADTVSFAQDSKGGKGGKGGNGGGRQGQKDEKPKAKDPKDTPEWKALEAVGREFAAKDAARLVARMAPDRKLKIRLGDYDSDYAADQAKAVLQKWFDSKKGSIALTLSKVEGDVGIFSMAITTGEKTRTWPLHVEIRKKDKAEGYHLVRIENPSAD